MHKQATHTNTNTNENACRCAPKTPREELDSSQRGRKEPKSSQVMHAQPSPFLQIMSSTHAMKSAHERAAYLRQHPASAAIQRQAARSSIKTAPAEGRISKGSRRRRAAAKAHAMQGSSLPDAAAAAALISSAAARRTKHRQRHRHDTQPRQLCSMKQR